MEKYLLTFEFRYRDGKDDHCTKTTTIGIYETVKDAVQAGNLALNELSKTFGVRDGFEVNGLFGKPKTLVTNTCYSNQKAEFFGKITTLDFADLSDTVNHVLKSRKDYEQYLKDQNED